MPAQETKDVPAKDKDQQQRVSFDDRDCKDTYANFFTVASTPEEVVVNFGVVNQERRNLVRLASRVYLNYFNAKRLMVGLMQAIKQYEDSYGVVELDPKKRSKK